MSNRADFLDEREQEAINNPMDFQHPEGQEPQYEPLSALERRANAYLEGIERNRLKQSVKHAIEHGASENKKSDHSDIEFNPVVFGPHKLSDFQKLHHVAECSEETKSKNLKNIKDGFKNLRSKS